MKSIVVYAINWGIQKILVGQLTFHKVIGNREREQMFIRDDLETRIDLNWKRIGLAKEL